jgi:hypothetical protein
LTFFLLIAILTICADRLAIVEIKLDHAEFGSDAGRAGLQSGEVTMRICIKCLDVFPG